MFTVGLIDVDSTLYILEHEDRVRTKRKSRKASKEVKTSDFLEYFSKNLENIARKFIDKESEAAKVELEATKRQIDPTQLEIDRYGTARIPQEITDKINRLKSVISSSNFDTAMLEPKLNNFLELAFKEGEYDPMGDDYYNRGRANLSQMVDIHTMPVVASMFLQFLTRGKVQKRFHTENVIKELGLEDLF